jgi:Virus neck protein
MATNPYFTDTYVSPTEDQDLVNQLIVESIQIKGWDHAYLPRTLNNFDSFFGEDQTSAFHQLATVEMYLETVQQWTDDGSFLSKFGLEIRDSAKLVVAISRFNETITTQFPEVTRPREGDIIAFSSPIDNRRRLFEITYVNNENPFYQIGKLYTYTMTVKNFEYTGETFNTGDATIDQYQVDNALVLDVTVSAGASSYVIGETVSQLSGFSGEVVAFVGAKLSLTRVKGELNHTDILLGDVSGAARTIATPDAGPHVDGPSIKPVNNDAMLNDNTFVDNHVVSGLVNFSESNPFSE